jgi:predicted MFS family arabinose efflux permease
MMGQLPDGDKSGTEIKNTEPSEASGLTWKEAFKTRKFWFLSIAMFCIGFTLWTVFVHIVPYAIDKGVSPETSALILSVMSISQPAGSLLVSTITGRLGNGRSLVVCMCLLLAVAFLILPISNPWLLGLIVIMLALGLGGTSVLQSSMTAELFGMKAHGAILGFSIFTFSLGSASGTYLAGLVYDATGSYEVAFSICGILIVVGIILAISLIRIKKTAAAV